MVPKLFLHVSQAAIFVEAVNTVNTVAINTILVLHLGKTGGLSIVRTCDRRNDPSYGYTWSVIRHTGANYPHILEVHTIFRTWNHGSVNYFLIVTPWKSARRCFHNIVQTGVREGQKVFVAHKKDRVSSVCPSGLLIYTSFKGHQVLQAPSEAWPAVKESMVYAVQ